MIKFVFVFSLQISGGLWRELSGMVLFQQIIHFKPRPLEVDCHWTVETMLVNGF